MKKLFRRMALLMTGAMLFSGCAANAEATANGVVVDATMNAAVVELAPARRIALSTEGADLSGLANGLRIGDAVTLRCEGALDGDAHLLSLSDCEMDAVRCAGEIMVEGTPEAVELTAFVGDGGYLLWYDAEAFAVREDADEGACFVPASPDAADGVGLQISARQDGDGAALLSALKSELETEGYVPAAAEEAQLPQDCVGGWICTGTEKEMQVYVFGTGASVYCAQAFYPTEAAEGWGTRMFDIIATMKLL